MTTSTSTTLTWAPNGNEAPLPLYTVSIVSGSSDCEPAESSAQVFDTVGVPATWKAPASLSSTMSASSASRSSAANFWAFSTSSWAALLTADPPCWSEREPMVPPPDGTRSVSPQTSVMRSIGMPVCSVVIIDQAVSWPWPCGDVPVYTVADPSSCTSILALSPAGGTPPVISTYTLTPMPSCLSSPDARRAACSARSSV